MRLNGADKAALDLAGTSALDRLVRSFPDGVEIVVAGPWRPVSRSATFRQESPSEGGPVAGIDAALTVITTPSTAIVAVDAPWSGRLIPDLVDALQGSTADVAVAVDPAGRRQLLCAVWRTSSLREALDRLGEPHGRSVRELFTDVEVREHALAEADAWQVLDIDTPADLEAARLRAADPTLNDTDAGQPHDHGDRDG
jgi:molybdenum cofactor guanylyltransferase